MVRLPTWVLPSLGVLIAGNAHAQSAAGVQNASIPRSRVSIAAPAKSVALQVVPVGGWQPIAECDNTCDFWALPGRYTLYLRDLSSGKERAIGLEIRHSARYLFQEGDAEAHYVGLGLGIAGSAAIGAGLLMTFSYVLGGTRQTSEIGLGVLAAGAIVTPLGWTMFARSRDRLVEQSTQSVNAGGPSLKLGVAGVAAAGVGLGALATF